MILNYQGKFFEIFLIWLSVQLIQFGGSIQPEIIDNAYEDTREFYSIQSLKNANNSSRFIKLRLVFDYSYYFNSGGNNAIIISRYQKILTIVNSLFQPFNIFIAFVDPIFWTKSDEIKIDGSINETYNEFESYAINQMDDSIDHMQLISWRDLSEHFFPSNKTDKMCTSSVGIIWERKDHENYIARYLAHILAYSIGMKDDLMSSRNYSTIHHWNSDTAESLRKISEDRGKFPCLNIKPNELSLYRASICGNNVTEEGEECDCGSMAECLNRCCNAEMCEHHHRVYCAYGECCDLKECEIRFKKGEMCRAASHSCDNPEFCDGKSEFCPINKFKSIGQECSIKDSNNIESICNGHSACRKNVIDKVICNSEGVCQRYRGTLPPNNYSNVISKATSSTTNSYKPTLSSSLTISTDSSSNAYTNSPPTTLSKNSHNLTTSTSGLYSNSSSNFPSDSSTSIPTILPSNTHMNFLTSSLPNSQTNHDSVSDQSSKQLSAYDNLLPAIIVFIVVILILGYISLVIVRRRLRSHSRDQDPSQTLTRPYYLNTPPRNNEFYNFPVDESSISSHRETYIEPYGAIELSPDAARIKSSSHHYYYPYQNENNYENL